ncbi:MAG: MFS transporter [Candidatus Omnitrophota bacterium]
MAPHPKDTHYAIDFKLIFRALRHRNYRLFFGGQSISLIGTWMQQVAMSWLVYRLTNSALLLGIVGFVGQLPTFLLAPLAGVIADRHNRHRILVVTQTLAMLQASVLSVLVLTNTIAVWHILCLSIFLGLINSLDLPVRQAFTVEMIEKREDLGNAIALNSSMVNAARLIGPSLAGILIAALGEGICFLLNALSYIAVIASLVAMKITSRPTLSSEKHVLHDLKEGFVYAFGVAPIKAILFLLGLVSLIGVPYQVLMPIFAKDIFHGGPKTLGFLMAMSGAGALMGAIYLAGRKSVIGLGKVIAAASSLFGLGIAVFALSRVLWFSMVMIGAAGFAMMVQLAASNTVLQTIVEEDKRGRIMSFYTMAFMGMAPFGSLLAGSLASKMGAPNTLLFGGTCCVIGGLLFVRQLPSLREEMRPIYIKKGILPEVASGIQAASGLKGASEL